MNEQILKTNERASELFRSHISRSQSAASGGKTAIMVEGMSFKATRTINPKTRIVEYRAWDGDDEIAMVTKATRKSRFFVGDRVQMMMVDWREALKAEIQDWLQA